MKNRKIVIVWLIVFFLPFFLFGQENNWPELNALLNEGRYFESKKLYQKVYDTLTPDMDLFYKFRMALFTNKNDSAAIYMEEMLKDYPCMFGDDTMRAYAQLFDLYAVDLRNYEKSVYTYKRMVQHLEENPYNLNETEVNRWKKGNESRVNYLKELVNQSPIKLKRGRTNDFARIEEDERLALETQFNGISRKVLYDTGCDFYCIMNREEAEAIGIKCCISEMEKGSINDTEVLIKKTYLDSIKIGNITLYNIPVTIFEHDIIPYLPDSVKENPGKMAYVDSIYSNHMRSSIGLPTMRLIGKFLIDYDSRKVTFPLPDYQSHGLKDSNIFLYESDLYTCLNLNGKNFVGTLDTGFDDWVKIDTSFYEKYKESIPIVPAVPKDPYNIFMPHRIWEDVSYKIASNPIIEFNNKPMSLPAESYIKIFSLRPMWYGEFFDGVIGYRFFKRIGRKVLLDLDNMRLEASE